MITCIEFINKILWSGEYPDTSKITVHYLDRIQNKLLSLSFGELNMEIGNKFNFTYKDIEGVQHEIPFHRIRQIKDGDEVIWERNIQIKKGD